MSDIDYYRELPVEDRRIAFQEHVSQAIKEINSRRWDYGREIGQAWTWENGSKALRLWNDYELNNYAHDILEQLRKMADEGDMICAGIEEREELQLIEVSARHHQDTDPPPPEGAVRVGVVVSVSVLGTPLSIEPVTRTRT